MTIHETANLQQRRIQLHKRIRLFRELQLIYTPATSIKLASQPCRDEQPEAVKLWMPSQLDDVSRERGCHEGLAEMEMKLRMGQCNDSLETVRMLLRGRSSMLKWRIGNISGQKATTRFGVAIERLKQKMRAVMDRYNHSRLALAALDAGGDWEADLQELRVSDMRMAGQDGESDFLFFDGDDDDDNHQMPARKKKKTLAEIAAPFVGEGRKTTSWIWTVSTALGSEDEQLSEGVYEFSER